MASRVRTCILLAYTQEQKGYELLDVKTGAIVTSHSENIRFHEQFTVDGGYINKLLLNEYFGQIRAARLRTSCADQVNNCYYCRRDGIIWRCGRLALRSGCTGCSVDIVPSSTAVKRKRVGADERGKLALEACTNDGWPPT